MKKKGRIRIVLFLLGFIGILSMLAVPIPANVPAEVMAQFSPIQLKLLSLINPTILLILAVWVGSNLYDRIGFQLPIFEGQKVSTAQRKSFIITGILSGLLAGLLIVGINAAFSPILKTELALLSQNLQLPLAPRFLYGGITEEILLRFGLMTALTWIFYKITKDLRPGLYYAAIFLSALVFALLHLPAVIQLVGDPSGSLIAYILIGNTVGGLIFGWVYWKKGLETAMLSHVMAHVVMVVVSLFIKV